MAKAKAPTEVVETAESNGAKDYTTYAGKAPTDLQGRFADWVIEKVGLTFATAKEEKQFRDGVRLGTALRIPFQASPENQDVRAQAAVTRAEAPVEKPAKAAKAVKAAKAAKPAAIEEPVDEAVAPATKAKAPKKAARSGAKAPF